MTSKKRLILPVDQNKLVLPEALIPENTKAFIYELQEDGRIMLSPLAESAAEVSEVLENPASHQVHDDLPNVIDFEKSRTRLKPRREKKKKVTGASEAETTDSLGDAAAFVNLYLFSSRLEAEMVGEILRQAEIPYLIQSEDIGIFGPGAAPVPGGARIAVRKADIEDAKVILSGLI